jgi:hypothetical protein
MKQAFHMRMTVTELKTETLKLSREEQAELAVYLTERLRRATNDQKELARMMDDGDPNFTDPRDEPLQTNRL